MYQNTDFSASDEEEMVLLPFEEEMEAAVTTANAVCEAISNVVRPDLFKPILHRLIEEFSTGDPGSEAVDAEAAREFYRLTGLTST